LEWGAKHGSIDYSEQLPAASCQLSVKRGKHPGKTDNWLLATANCLESIISTKTQQLPPEINNLAGS
jgi:hypothetical protein